MNTLNKGNKMTDLDTINAELSLTFGEATEAELDMVSQANEELASIFGDASFSIER